MKMFEWIRNLRRTEKQKPDNASSYVYGSTVAGPYIDENSAQTYSAVWRCVRVISNAIAQLPWKVYQRTSNGKKEAEGHPVQWLLNTQPNPEMTAFRFKRLMVREALLWGNAYCEIERDTMGRPIWLWPIESERVEVLRDPSGDLFYRVRATTGDVYLTSADVLHFRGPDDDGVVGSSIIGKAKNAIGLGLAMEQFGSAFFGNGAHVGGALKHPKVLSPEAKKNLEESLKKNHAGRKAMGTMILEEGMEYVRIGIPPEDAQFLESRKHQVVEICRWFGVPPHKAMELDRATWNNIEHQAIEFVTDTIVPWTCNFEEEVNVKLFGRVQRGLFYTKFSLNALLRGDTKSRYDAYAVGRQWGWLSANDVRALEDMNPVEDGDLYLVPANMMPAEHAANPPKPASPPASDPEQPDPPPEQSPRARLLNLARNT